ncbi:kin of IRRE-like protein 1 [Trichonephila clavipes]|nr:kin of IRRE-like protein 1 [Trichonephila clavipes]
MYVSKSPRVVVKCDINIHFLSCPCDIVVSDTDCCVVRQLSRSSLTTPRSSPPKIGLGRDRSKFSGHLYGAQSFGALFLQVFDTLPQDREVNPGELIVIPCKVRNRKGECAWLKDGVVVGKIPGKYTFNREPDDGDCGITITNTQLEDDDGLWQCQVTQASLQELTLTSPEVKLTVREFAVGSIMIESWAQVLISTKTSFVELVWGTLKSIKTPSLYVCILGEFGYWDVSSAVDVHGLGSTPGEDMNASDHPQVSSLKIAVEASQIVLSLAWCSKLRLKTVVI